MAILRPGCSASAWSSSPPATGMLRCLKIKPPLVCLDVGARGLSSPTRGWNRVLTEGW